METACIAYGVNNDAMYTWVYSRTVARGAVVNINIGLYLPPSFSFLPSFSPVPPVGAASSSLAAPAAPRTCTTTQVT